jgi:hypothetical protein
VRYTVNRPERISGIEAQFPIQPLGQVIKQMPYFVYKIKPSPLQLTHIETKDKYRDARTLVRELRQDRSEGQGIDYRMVFANRQAEAEKLLSTPRDARVIGED